MWLNAIYKSLGYYENNQIPTIPLKLERRCQVNPAYQSNHEEKWDQPVLWACAIWSPDRTKIGTIVPFRTFSRIKWASTSMCLVLSWRTESDESIIADLLSQNNWNECRTNSPNSSRREQSQIISQDTWAIAWYSTSVDDLAVTFCFFPFHDIKWRLRKVTHLEVDRLLVLFSA